MLASTFLKSKKITSEQLFMLSVLLVNGGNYFYNLILGRLLGPSQFADAVVLVTFLLVLSFLAMTFQLVTTKFSALLEYFDLSSFINSIFKLSVITGIIIGAIIIALSKWLQQALQTQNSMMFVIFGTAVPVYFILSVNRGFLQGNNQFKPLSITYQLEMVTRLVLTVSFLLFIPKLEPIISVSIGIVISLIAGFFPFKLMPFIERMSIKSSLILSRPVKHFFIVTLFYELTQIIINNSDILLVKHFFNSYDAGLYASLALIGRVVYFMAWMFVMLLLPKVIELKKNNKNTTQILFKYVSYITLLCTVIVIGTILLPETIVSLLFGDEYLEIAPLLWKYAVATSLFAIANIFSYYFLSLGNYIPVIISGIMGMMQVAMIYWFHDSLHTVVLVQIIAMVVLLTGQVLYFCQSKTDQNHSSTPTGI
ncbi:capsular polysaccharide biosynthesis protein [Nonlabens tegetincola]|uniref:Capsular polysaccharide biosynthesis protein n=1 Tax=Nonlabens tegetincola TaxID=323273 RepID=A0A090PYC4_9FLAO|nr:oligosaccharide flippase family protein [Nonlabens tegetincola]GAK95854.1 capsular polysaccharide biosynthesis protein [Nonlabens tegetincola]